MLRSIAVTRKGTDRWANGHPWIFRSDLAPDPSAEPGTAVEVKDHRGKFIGIAHYSSTSQIALRRLSTRRDTIGESFYQRRILQALDHRRRVVENSDAYRLIFSEADLLPGLIVDVYGPYLVVQTLTQGMDRDLQLIAGCLTGILHPEGILVRNDANVRKLEDLPQETRVLSGDIPEQATITMNGLQFRVNLVKGQKTGAHLDQRENYLAAARHARGRVLDCFTSSGGFAVHIAKLSQAESIEAADSSALAIETARANAGLNGISSIQFREADVFDFLSGAGRDVKYDTIILDPPAFAKSRKQVDDALRGYRDINLRALKMLAPGGVLVTCSCSHHINEGLLFQVVAEAALAAGKTLRVLERRTQAACHPILLTVPETLYLKCLILQAVD